MKNKKALYGGLLGGIGCVFYTSIFYWINPSLIFSPWILWSGLVFYIIPMYMAATFEAENLTFSQTLRLRIRQAFLTFIIANAVYYLFYYILLNYIDQQLVVLQYEILQKRIENMGAAGENLKSMYKNNRPEDLRMTVGKTLFSFGRGLIGGFTLSVIVAYISERTH